MPENECFPHGLQPFAGSAPILKIMSDDFVYSTLKYDKNYAQAML